MTFADPQSSPERNRPQAVFSAVLTPYRSLGRRGFVVVMALLAAAAAIGAGRAYAIGAWPVSLFVILELVLVYGAFKLSYRAACAFEEVTLWPNELLVRQVTPSGRTREHRFHPYWAKLKVTRIDDEGVVRLAIASRGQTLTIGSFLNPADRETFAAALAAALGSVHGAPAAATTAG
jgi:uncharacterized membrane protein